MNQSSNSASAPRAAGVAEAPEISYVIRSYLWVMLAGTLLCALLAGGLYVYFYKTSPRYTATVYFQVLPQAAPVGNKNFQVAPPTQEEITRFIRRQMLFIKSDPVLDRILQQDEFQHDARDPTSSRKSQWLQDNIDQAKKHLKEDLNITPLPASDVFTIDMTTKDAAESARLVNAIARVYQDSLSNETKLNTARNLEQSQNALQQQEDVVRQLERELADFRKANDIDALTGRHTLQLQVLGEIDTQYTKIQGEVIAAGQEFNAIKRQVETNTLQLSSDAQREVDGDPELRGLQQNRLALEQEHEVLLSEQGKAARAVKDVETRMDVVDRQMADRRRKVEDQAKLHMQSQAESLFQGLSAQMEYLKKARDEKETEIRGMDRWLVLAQQKNEALTAQKDVLANLRANFALEKLTSSTDESRIRRYGGEAVPPEDISWPIAWKFVVPGVAIGLILSFSLAFLYEVTNTRVRTPRDITRTLQMPLLGFIPDQDDDRVKGELSTTIRTAPSSMIAESFRQIRGRLMAEGDGAPVKTLLVASISPGGGATTVASNIATGMALNAVRVLLVDANFYRPGIRNSYKNVPATGLADVIASPEALEGAIVASVEMPNLHVMGTGHVGTTNPAEMLESKGFRELLEVLKSRYDMVVFDGAPLSLVSDSVALGARVDGVIAVVRAGEVSRGTVARVREQLRQVRAHFMGVVLNAAQTHGAGYFKENYRTFYKYAGQGAKANGAAVH